VSRALIASSSSTLGFLCKSEEGKGTGALFYLLTLTKSTKEAQEFTSCLRRNLVRQKATHILFKNPYDE